MRRLPIRCAACLTLSIATLVVLSATLGCATAGMSFRWQEVDRVAIGMSQYEVENIMGPAEHYDYRDGCMIWTWSFARVSLIGVGSAARAVGVFFHDDKVVLINRVNGDKVTSVAADGWPPSVEVSSSQSSVTYGDSSLHQTTPPNIGANARDSGIDVLSTIVKKVGGKFRYFFDVRNHGRANFYGTVTITLLNRQPDTRNGVETFTSNGIPAGLGTAVYMDIFTGPPAVHGDYGVERFSYEVEDGGVIVDHGTGAIADRLELY